MQKTNRKLMCAGCVYQRSFIVAAADIPRTGENSRALVLQVQA